MELQKYTKFQITTDCSAVNKFCLFALCAYFDESMDCIGGYKPWKT